MSQDTVPKPQDHPTNIMDAPSIYADLPELVTDPPRPEFDEITCLDELLAQPAEPYAELILIARQQAKLHSQNAILSRPIEFKPSNTARLSKLLSQLP